MHIPRVIVSGLSGGAGKTMLSLGLARSFTRLGHTTRAFKKGPDYIDAAWLAKAARAPQANLDPFFTPGHSLVELFKEAAHGYSLAIIEGNRGLFDGLDLEGSCSTAEVARLLSTPVLLSIDCTKMTRTVAAMVKGCLSFEENLRIGGVLLNRTGNERHRNMVRRAVEDLCGVPVMGVLPRMASPFIIERHMGLAGMDECERTESLLDSLADFVEQHADISAILSLAETAPDFDASTSSTSLPSSISSHPTVSLAEGSAQACEELPLQAVRAPVIGYVLDAAFWFYYQENLDALQRAGATLTPLSLLSDKRWPEIDGLYIGGGLPELHADALSANNAMREHVASLSRAGLPIYAECGGFMYLARELRTDTGRFAMAGVFDLAIHFYSTPRGLGYVEAESVSSSPYHPAGSRFRGHEFHFSGIEEQTPPPGSSMTIDSASMHLQLFKGQGMAGDTSGKRFDGLLYRQTFASYLHIYAPAVPHWAPKFVDACRKIQS